MIKTKEAHISYIQQLYKTKTYFVMGILNVLGEYQYTFPLKITEPQS